MTDATQPRLHPLADTSPSAVVAGFIAMMTGYTSSLVLMFQAGQAAGLTSGQISSWIWALSIGMAICSIGLSLRYRTPITIAWSTPGAALLITSLGGVSYHEAIGAYITCAVLVIICGMTGSFERLVKRIPSSLAAALLAGILFKIGSEIFVAAQHRTGLVIGMFFTYLIVKRLSPRYAVLAALVIGTLISGLLGLLDFSGFALEVAVPVWTTPSFSLAATISIGIPLFVVAMTSQNMPGIAVLRADGYNVPASPLITTTGVASLLLHLLAPTGLTWLRSVPQSAPALMLTKTLKSATPQPCGAGFSTASPAFLARHSPRCSQPCPRSWCCRLLHWPCSVQSSMA